MQTLRKLIKEKDKKQGCNFNKGEIGMPGWLSGWASAFGSGRDPGIWDLVPHQAPCGEPASPSAYVSASLSVSLMNKSF